MAGITGSSPNSDIVVARIQNRRGNRVNLPQPLEPGELGWCLDTKQLFIGLTEEDAVAGIEIYRGGTVNAQPLVQQIIDTHVIEFNSYYTRLNTTTRLQQDPTKIVSEESLLADLRAIPSSTFVDIQKRDIVDEIEQNIELIDALNTVATDAVDTAITNAPAINTTITLDNSALITYDWMLQGETSVVVEVSSVNGTGGITGVTISDPGLGYIPAVGQTTITLGIIAAEQGTGAVLGTGAAGFVCAVNQTTTEGRVTSSAAPITVGTGYDVGNLLTLTIPTQDATTATGHIDTLSQGGSIASITIDTGGLGYAAAPEVIITSGTGTGAELEVIMNADSVFEVNIITAGSGYLLSDSISFAAPKTSALYKFKYDVGINFYEFTPPDIDNTPSLTRDYLRLKEFISTLRNSVYSYDGALVSAILDAGVLGLDITNTANNEFDADFYPRANEMVNGFLLLDTARQSSNVAALSNELSDSAQGLATTKQNVEIITEFSSQDLSPDLLFETPITYELPATGTYPALGNWAQVDNTVLGNFEFLPLEYSVDESDSQILNFSTHHNTLSTSESYNSTGTLLVTTNPSISTNAATLLTDNSIEVRGTGLDTLNTGGQDIDFRSVYDGVRNVVGIEYRHNFSANIIMRLTTRRWKSF